MDARPIKILSTGKYLPRKKVDSTSFDERLGKSAGSTFNSSGVRSRHHADPLTETVSFMGAEAAKAALKEAGMKLSDVSAIVCASSVQQQSIPYTASLISKELGPEACGIPCLDVNATCLSFIAALDTFSYLLSAGKYETVLIVSAENASVGVDPEDPHTCSLFGDGAAAVLVKRSGPGENSTILASGLETYSEGSDLCVILGGGTRVHPRFYGEPGFEKAFTFQMDGLATIKLALKWLPPFVDRILDRAALKMSDLALVIPHQASKAGMEILRKKIDVPEDRWMNILENHGNMISASIPLAIRHAVKDGRISRGDKILLLGTSAGFSVGGAVLVY
jgi:3-oxoacyl-[acyl-carrier-protein] synthase-3